MVKCGLFVILLLQNLPLVAQDAVRVFRTASDSLAFLANDHALQQLRGPSADPKILDSLLAIRSHIINNSFLGWRYAYHTSEDYVLYDNLSKNQTPPEEIRKLSIVHLPSRRLPKLLYACKNLEALELIDTRITHVPRKLNRLAKLHVLSIYNNHSPRELSLKKNRQISYLKIRSYNPGQSPTRFGRLPSLDSLDLARNFLASFPDIRHNHRLKKLILSENNLTLEDLRTPHNESLEVLYLRRNKIKKVPDAIGNFVQLKDLSLNHNQIEEIGEGLANLKNLRELSLYQNLLKVIPNSIYALTNLKEVDFYFNAIEKVGDDIKNLAQLEVLYLANNQLYSLSENIGQLPRLRALYLHHNRISYFPNSISSLTTLRVLRINHNFFAEFPDQLLHLEKLENLDLSYNRMPAIPPTLGNLHQLKLLVMVDNPWEDPEAITALAEKMRANGTLVHLSAEDETGAGRMTTH